jgi:D-lactate dehydrogenase
MGSLDSGFLHELTSLLGGEAVMTEAADCWPYGGDNSRKRAQPDAVVFPTTHEQVSAIVRSCNRYRVPLVVRGRGTGTVGGAIPNLGGVVLSTENMQRIIDTDPANRLMVVEPGVTNQAVQDEAGRHGFFWPPDPTSAAFCTVGGNLAFNAAGPRAVKYGTCRENVLGLRAVTGTGETVHTGVLTTKGVVGYDLTRLIVGSEGTLAVITRAVLKLTPLPEAKRTLQAVYATVADATAAVVRIMSQPNTPCALEFIDGNAVDMIRDYSEADLPDRAGAMLMIEVDGPQAGIDGSLKAVEAAASGAGLLRLRAASTAQEVSALWSTRKALSPALRKIAPNKLNEDVVVPVSRIPDLVEGLEVLSREHGIPIVNFGHAGNGNIHVNLLYDAQDAEQEREARPCLSRVFDLVLSLGGTLSGEHGVGNEKRDYVAREIDAATLALMAGIKRQFDPNGILNPGKMLPLPVAAA